VSAVRIGVSSCFFHADPQRAIFKGKTLVYAEQSLVDWAMSEGDLAWPIPPRPAHVPIERVVDQLSGLLLEGGSDLSPTTYGEEPLRPEWAGDRVRDLYEIELLRAFLAAGKPVLGVCRGLQLVNAAQGGTLYQDITTQVPGARVHRDWNIYDANIHQVRLTGRLAALYGEGPHPVSSVHHQAVKDLGRDLVVEAISVEDDVVEAIRWTGPTFLAAVQWHPEFHADPSLLDGGPLLHEFLDEARRFPC
jgi:putative glutamine amidotransferase